MKRVAMALVLVLSACGGKVVFVEEDGSGDGGNGAGSSSGVLSNGGSTVTTTPIPTTSTGTSPSGGAGPGISCEDFDCSVGQTFCSCMGECGVCFGDTCSGADVEQSCTVSGNGMACQCFLGGELVGTCAQQSADCGLQTGCCLDTFLAFLR